MIDPNLEQSEEPLPEYDLTHLTAARELRSQIYGYLWAKFPLSPDSPVRSLQGDYEQLLAYVLEARDFYLEDHPLQLELRYIDLRNVHRYLTPSLTLRRLPTRTGSGKKLYELTLHVSPEKLPDSPAPITATEPVEDSILVDTVSLKEIHECLRRTSKEYQGRIFVPFPDRTLKASFGTDFVTIDAIHRLIDAKLAYYEPVTGNVVQNERLFLNPYPTTTSPSVPPPEPTPLPQISAENPWMQRVLTVQDRIRNQQAQASQLQQRLRDIRGSLQH